MKLKFAQECEDPRGGACERLSRRADKPVVKRAGVIIHWKRVVFSAALFWFWYLTPVVASRLEQVHAFAPLASLLGR